MPEKNLSIKTRRRHLILSLTLFIAPTMTDTEEIRKSISQGSEIMVVERGHDGVMTAYEHPALHNPNQMTSMATFGHGEHPVDTKWVRCYWYDDDSRRQSAVFEVQNLSVLR